MKAKLIVAFAVTALQLQMAQAQTSVGNFITGGAKVDAIEHNAAAQAVPKPEHVLIRDFAVRPDDITLDQSIAGRLRRKRLALQGSDEDSSPEVLVQRVQASFFKGFSGELANVHVAPAKADGTAPGSNASNLVVDGAFTAIDEGNKSKRVMIGFGSGSSHVKTRVTVSSITAGRSTVLLSFELDSQGSKTPGALVPIGGGSLAVGTGVGVATDGGSTVEADASRMGKLAAKQIETLMRERNWLASPAVDAVSPAQSIGAAG